METPFLTKADAQALINQPNAKPFAVSLVLKKEGFFKTELIMSHKIVNAPSDEVALAIVFLAEKESRPNHKVSMSSCIEITSK